MANPLSLNRPFFCDHCGDNLTATYDPFVPAFVLMCPRTREAKQTIDPGAVPSLRLEERERLLFLLPECAYLIPTGT